MLGRCTHAGHIPHAPLGSPWPPQYHVKREPRLFFFEYLLDDAPSLTAGRFFFPRPCSPLTFDPSSPNAPMGGFLRWRAARAADVSLSSDGSCAASGSTGILLTNSTAPSVLLAAASSCSLARLSSSSTSTLPNRWSSALYSSLQQRLSSCGRRKKVETTKTQ